MSLLSFIIAILIIASIFNVFGVFILKINKVGLPVYVSSAVLSWLSLYKIFYTFDLSVITCGWILSLIITKIILDYIITFMYKIILKIHETLKKNEFYYNLSQVIKKNFNVEIFKVIFVTTYCLFIAEFLSFYFQELSKNSIYIIKAVGGVTVISYAYYDKYKLKYYLCFSFACVFINCTIKTFSIYNINTTLIGFLDIILSFVFKPILYGYFLNKSLEVKKLENNRK